MLGTLLVWEPVLYRAVSFWFEARATFAADNSVHSWNDVLWAEFLLKTYSLGLLVGLGASFAAGRSQSAFGAGIWAVNSACALWLGFARAERVVVLFPTPEPAIALAVNGVLLIAGVAALMRRWLLTRRLKNP